MVDLANHAAYRGRVFQRATAMPLVEAEPFQRRLLVGTAPDRAAGLHHRQCFLAVNRSCRHQAVSRVSASWRPRISATRLPRRAATARGLVTWLSAAKVALIILCGFELPTDLATMSCTPSASKIA